MRRDGNELRLSATDLATFLACRHRTALDMARAAGKRSHAVYEDPLLDILIQRGRDHEARYVASLRAAGLTAVEITTDDPAATHAAMREGAHVIVQGTLADGRWHGRTDILRRVETPSAFGNWSYEVYDTKLARETKAGTILQLGLYSDMLARAQGAAPERFHVVTPDPVEPTQSYRVADFAAYFRLVRRQMEATVAQDDATIAAANYPEPVDHCDVCPWSPDCKAKRHEDDHLSLVANLSRVQRRELESRSVTTLTGLAQLPLPIAPKPKRGNLESYLRAREQARVQLESRNLLRPRHELRAVEEGRGLCRLPEPSPGDIFLDLEGDPMAVESGGGREYLFGYVILSEAKDLPSSPVAYQAHWAFTEPEEKAAFEWAIDLIVDRLRAHPGMHVYHYAPYEPSAFKRLMGRHATRERELDELLRAERFVDLYAVVREGLFAGVERYSIKNLEPLYDFTRAVPLSEANRNLPRMQAALQTNSTAELPMEVLGAVRGYNQDDCVSTLRLRDWLEQVRGEAVAQGQVIERPVLKAGAASEEIDDRAKRVEALRARLLVGISQARAERSVEQQARWILAYLLDWHRREDKATWWEYFALCDMTEEQLLDQPRAVAGLEWIERVDVIRNKKTGKPTGTVVDRYRYPAQEMEIARANDLKLQDKTAFGKVVATDRAARTIDVSKGKKQAEHHPRAAFEHTYYDTKVQEQAIYAVAERVANEGAMGVEPGAPDRAARDLLLANPPRLKLGPFHCTAPEVDYAIRIAGDLAETVLAIQGPPGAGKTYCGARMIAALVAQGKRVGVVATGHKVIRQLLDKVHEADPRVRLGHKFDDDGADDPPHLTNFEDNDTTRAALDSGDVQVLGGTAWLWARRQFANAVDVLFVDEAGQMSLANVVAISPAARSLVLLGDPRQLEQPQRGSHPDGVGAAALQHILGEHLTIPSSQGVFLPVTWRLAPSICSFTSELFYEGKLRSRDGLERQVLSGTDGFDGAGLRVVEVSHDGNRNYSDEEVAVVVSLVSKLTAPGVRWTNADGFSPQVTGGDVLVVAPYNAQVSRLTAALAESGARVGTVDKFQGHEAPVVIYSMATSRAENAPRGMAFLYSANRLNVATSRAQCAVFLVASGRLFEAECGNVGQMKLANGVCRFHEKTTGRIRISVREVVGREGNEDAVV